MSIAALLQAAEYIERRDRVMYAEAEHGYASSMPPAPTELRTNGRRSKSKKSHNSRTTHNELEKNRRAHLRSCLEKLKDLVPLGADSTRHTTLGLLTKSKKYIKNLEEREKKLCYHKEQLARSQRYLRRRLARLRGRITNSECEMESTTSSCAATAQTNTRTASLSSLDTASSGISTASPASISESDEVDVIGYTSNQSECESVISGDSGVANSSSLRRNNNKSRQTKSATAIRHHRL